MPVALHGQTLLLEFPELHPDAVLNVTFHRTLRVPDDGQNHRLPPGLRQQRLRIEPELGGERPQHRLGRPFRAPLHQGEIGGGDADPAGQGADREPTWVRRGVRQAGLAQCRAGMDGRRRDHKR